MWGPESFFRNAGITEESEWRGGGLRRREDAQRFLMAFRISANEQATLIRLRIPVIGCEGNEKRRD